MNFDLCTVMFVTADVIVICKVHASVFALLTKCPRSDVYISIANITYN